VNDPGTGTYRRAGVKHGRSPSAQPRMVRGGQEGPPAMTTPNRRIRTGTHPEPTPSKVPPVVRVVVLRSVLHLAGELGDFLAGVLGW